MVAAVERNDLVAASVQARHTNSVFVCVSTTVGKEDLLETLGSVRENFLRCEGTNVVGVCGCHRSEHISLSLDGFNHLGVLVANVDVDEHRREVEVGIAFVVPNVGTLASSDDKRRESALC